MNKIDELKAALAAATPGEWVYQESVNTDEPLWRIDADHGTGEDTVTAFTHDEEDAHLITLMKNALPALIECAEALPHLVTSADELRNGWHPRELHEPIDDSLDRARAALTKLGIEP